MIQKNFVGVVARSEIGAIRAAESLKVTWNDPGGVPANYDALYAKMASSPASSRLLVNDGNVDKALAGAAKVVEATYYYPYQLHGSMGPSCAIADVKGDEATVWSPTQGVYPLRTAVAKLLGFQDRQVHVIYKEGLGVLRPERGRHGLDRRGPDVEGRRRAGARAVDALGRARLGALRDADDPQGQGRSRRGRQPDRLGLRVPSGGARRPSRQRWRGEPAHRRPDRAHAPGDAASAPSFPPLGADNSNTVAGYLLEEEGTVPNARVIARTVDSPFFTGPLRSPARIQNTFANECFIDELAAAAGVDPVTFRLRYVGDERLRHVIEVAAKAADWQLRNSPKPASRATWPPAVGSPRCSTRARTATRAPWRRSR